ncbi:MAG: glycosyltransferase family 4 protein [Candidatus Methylomirabilales bacterium]
MDLFALTFGGADTASTYYRLLQYRDLFSAAGIRFDHAPAKEFRDYGRLRDFDTVLLQKVLLSRGRLRSLRRCVRRLLYDADDRIWLSPYRTHSWITQLRIGRRMRAIARSADVCLAANGVIAADLEGCGGRTVVVPMALDDRVWQVPPERRDPVTVGWTGAPKNLVFLRGILPELLEVQHRFPHVRFLVHCGQDPRFEGLRYEHLPFVPGEEPAAVGRFHIGLLPLPDDQFVYGKSPGKALQYFACGVAVAGSPVGATREILADGENALWVRERRDWVAALTRLIEDAELRVRLAVAGRRTFEERHALPVVFRRLRAVLVEGVEEMGRRA